MANNTRTNGWLAVVLLLLTAGPAGATEYVVPGDQDVGNWFAQLPKDATSVVFSAAAKYHSNGDIVLPYCKLLVIDGKGCDLVLGAASNGFTYAVADMQDAMKRTGSRYVIKDFASITGGKKAIDLKATLGSVVENCQLAAQTEAAIDLRFCLMARLGNVLVTNPLDKGIVLRQGDWPGASGTNSQSNSSVLDQCRVYCSKTTTAAYTILNSGGVRMTNCVSEGSPCDYDVFLSATLNGDESRPASNPVVKSFMLSNFHVEHQVRKASLYVNMPSKAVVDVENVYWNGQQRAPVVLYTMGQLNLSDIGWWDPGNWIGTRISAPRINLSGLPKEVDTGTAAGANGAKATGVVRLADQFAGNDVLQLNYVNISRKSW